MRLGCCSAREVAQEASLHGAVEVVIGEQVFGLFGTCSKGRNVLMCMCEVLLQVSCVAAPGPVRCRDQGGKEQRGRRLRVMASLPD